MLHWIFFLNQDFDSSETSLLPHGRDKHSPRTKSLRVLVSLSLLLSLSPAGLHMTFLSRGEKRHKILGALCVRDTEREHFFFSGDEDSDTDDNCTRASGLRQGL